MLPFRIRFAHARDDVNAPYLHRCKDGRGRTLVGAVGVAVRHVASFLRVSRARRDEAGSVEMVKSGPWFHAGPDFTLSALPALSLHVQQTRRNEARQRRVNKAGRWWNWETIDICYDIRLIRAANGNEFGAIEHTWWIHTILCACEAYTKSSWCEYTITAVISGINSETQVMGAAILLLSATYPQRPPTEIAFLAPAAAGRSPPV